MNILVRSGFVVAMWVVANTTFADVFYTEIIEAKSGVSGEQIQANWTRHRELWKKKSHADDMTGMSAQIVGDKPRGRYFFFISAPTFRDLGSILDELLSDPDWAGVIAEWDQLRVIRESSMFQEIPNQ